MYISDEWISEQNHEMADTDGDTRPYANNSEAVSDNIVNDKWERKEWRTEKRKDSVLLQSRDRFDT